MATGLVSIVPCEQVLFLILLVTGPIYGYIPSKLYCSSRRTFKRLFTSFVGALILDVFLTTIVTIAYVLGAEWDIRADMIPFIAYNFIPPPIP